MPHSFILLKGHGIDQAEAETEDFIHKLRPCKKIYNLDVHINALASINQIINKFIRISNFTPTLSLAILKKHRFHGGADFAIHGPHI